MMKVSFDGVVVEIPAFTIVDKPVPGTYLIESKVGRILIYPTNLGDIVIRGDNETASFYAIVKHRKFIEFFKKNDFGNRVNKALDRAIFILKDDFTLRNYK